MKCIIGFGNPEKQFIGTRHNAGFFLIDSLAQTFGVSFTNRSKFQAEIAEITHKCEKILLVKPTTYYNQVGETARALLDFYKLSTNDFLIIHDDLALPLGTIRTRNGGSDGGNNGLKSLASHIGAQTARIRIGVWTEKHFGGDNVAIVLGKFNQAEQQTLDAQVPLVAKIVDEFLSGNFSVTTHR